MPELIGQFDFSEVDEKITQHKELDFNNLESEGPLKRDNWLHYISEKNDIELGKQEPILIPIEVITKFLRSRGDQDFNPNCAFILGFPKDGITVASEIYCPIQLLDASGKSAIPTHTGDKNMFCYCNKTPYNFLRVLGIISIHRDTNILTPAESHFMWEM